FTDLLSTYLYTLSLHDALPILFPFNQKVLSKSDRSIESWKITSTKYAPRNKYSTATSSQCNFRDRKSTRLNSSHVSISYAVFCLKKKKTNKDTSNLDKTTKIHA